MRQTLSAAQHRKLATVLREYKHRKLHSGSGGPVVTDRQQAVAIALAQARRQK